jgi:hexulose-6-phosphate isomerase
MRFGLNGMCFPADSTDENFAIAAKAGYDGVEPPLSVEEHLGEESAVAAVADAADDHGLDVPTTLTPGFWEYPLTSTDPETRERGVEVGEQLVAAAATLGADTVLVVPGQVDAETPYDEAYENALQGVREIADAAGKRGVTLAVENVWNDFLYSPLEFREFVDAASEAGPVGAYFDVGNVVRFGYPDQWIHILGDRIEAVHVKDYDLDVDTIDGFTYPLQGHVPWGEVAAALDDIGYDGWVTPEVPPYETMGQRMPAQVLDNLHAVFE